MPKLWMSLLLISALGSGTAVETQERSPADEAALRSAAEEFPPDDTQVWQDYRRMLLSIAATRGLKDAPDSLTTLDALLDIERLDEALRVLRQIVETRPDRLADALERVIPTIHQFLRERQRGYADRLRELADAARARLGALSREDAARADRALLGLDVYLSPGTREAMPVRLEKIVRDHAGTDTALSVEVDLINHDVRDPSRLEKLERLTREHPRTAAAAKALYSKGQSLQRPPLGESPFGGDPTERFLQVLDIVKELESGAYPDCEWVRNARELVASFGVMKPSFANGNIDRMLEGYRRFVASHLTLGVDVYGHDRSFFIVTSRMAELYAMKGELIPGIERELAGLERSAPDSDAIRYQRAMFYMRPLSSLNVSSAEGIPDVPKAMALLRALHDKGQGIYQRKALATLAALAFYRSEFAEARQHYTMYLQRYPKTPWSWVAALRLGQIAEELGEPAIAAKAYTTAASYSSVPLAVVLGHAFAARAYEGDGRLDRATVEYERLLAGWDDAVGRTPYLYTSHRREGDSPLTVFDGPRVSRQALPSRIAQLKRSMGSPGGAELERGRWLLDKGRFDEARRTLEAILATHSSSIVTSEARYLAHRARLEAALDLAHVDSPNVDQKKAIAELDALIGEPYDFAICAAKIAKASILWTTGASQEAEALMRTALDEWRIRQVTQRVPAAGTLERDVLEIRNAVFLPLGGGVLSSSRWNAFAWPFSLKPFVVTKSELTVSTPGEDPREVSVAIMPPGMNQTLFFGTDDIALVTKIMTRVGGTRTRQPRAVMETPNQPVGASLEVLALWTRFFAARAGHWGGWELETYPQIGRVEFLDAARTKASVALTIGYSGGTVLLEKSNGVWKSTALVNIWIT